MEPRRQIPEPTYQWPGGPTADDDPTPIESALAALKIGAILAAAVTIAFIYLGTYAGIVAGRRRSPPSSCWPPSCCPSLIAAARTAWVRRRRGQPLTLRYTYWLDSSVALRSGPVPDAKVAELADAPDLGSGGETLESSSLSFRTTRLTDR